MTNFYLEQDINDNVVTSITIDAVNDLITRSGSEIPRQPTDRSFSMPENGRFGDWTITLTLDNPSVYGSKKLCGSKCLGASEWSLLGDEVVIKIMSCQDGANTTYQAVAFNKGSHSTPVSLCDGHVLAHQGWHIKLSG